MGAFCVTKKTPQKGLPCRIAAHELGACRLVGLGMIVNTGGQRKNFVTKNMGQKLPSVDG